MPAGQLNDNQVFIGESDGKVDSLCPYCGVGCQVTFHVKDDAIVRVEGRDGPANENRLCVKGRFGFDYARHPHRLTKPLIRKEGAAKDGHARLDPGDPFTHFREATWEEALDLAAGGFRTIMRSRRQLRRLPASVPPRARTRKPIMVQKLVRQGFGTNNVDHCTRLCHASSVAALMEGINSAAPSPRRSRRPRTRTASSPSAAGRRRTTRSPPPT